MEDFRGQGEVIQYSRVGGDLLSNEEKAVNLDNFCMHVCLVFLYMLFGSFCSCFFVVAVLCFFLFLFNQVELPVKDLLCSELLNQGIIVGKTGSAKGMPVFIPLR